MLGSGSVCVKGDRLPAAEAYRSEMLEGWQSGKLLSETVLLETMSCSVRIHP